MAAKPGTLPAWGTDATFTSGPETGSDVVVEPSAGEKSQGFVPGGAFKGPWVNWLFNLIYQWIQYLNDGAFTGNHTITGGTLSVGGQISATGGAGNVVASGAGGVTAQGAGADVKANGDFLYCTTGGSATTKADALLCDLTPVFAGAGWTWDIATNTWTTTSTNTIRFLVRPPAGCTLTGVSIGADLAGAAAVNAALYRKQHGLLGAASRTLVTAAATSASAGFRTAAMTAGAESAQDGFLEYEVVVTPATSGDELHWLRMSFTTPGPRSGA